MTSSTGMFYETPLISATTSIGKTKYWIGRVWEVDGIVSTNTEFWQDGAKHQESAMVYVTGKQGRSDLAQGIAEINSQLQKKLDKGYHPVGENHGIADQDRPPILPMLAHEFTKRGKNLTFPCFAQAKENGVRCLYDGTTFWSRQGNRFIPEVVQHLHFYAESIVFDGELVLPAPYTFQQTIAAVKKFRDGVTTRSNGDGVPASEFLEYRIYDAYCPLNPALSYRDRLALIQNHLDAWPNGQVYAVNTVACATQDELMAAHADFAAVAEGTIARNTDAPYKPDHRSVDLLKIKDTQDAEYEITGFGEGTGKDMGTIIFTCVTPEGRSFSVRPKGTVEHRTALFMQGPRLVGKPLTVKYQTLTDDGVPLFPVGLTIRDYE